VRVTVNGEARELRDGATVDELVTLVGFAGRRIAVEVNLDVVPRDRIAQHVLRDGDVIEIVQFIGGG
jgi:sulfur carrier protein